MMHMITVTKIPCVATHTIYVFHLTSALNPGQRQVHLLVTYICLLLSKDSFTAPLHTPATHQHKVCSPQPASQFSGEEGETPAFTSVNTGKDEPGSATAVPEGLLILRIVFFKL